ncbi:MAG: hypothetical protein IE922_02870 [Sphingomonadales bacterium]|nr:hypothetical protein [Sphingomonadales bacterium]
MGLNYWIAGALLAAALPAGAATVSETSLGEFSASWTAPTTLAAGTDTVTGSGAAGDTDVFVLSGLNDSVTGLTLAFSGADYYSAGWYGAGGSVLYSTDPFEWAWDGTNAGSFSVGYMSLGLFSIGTLEDSLTIPVSMAGSSTLYVALVYTYGQRLDYTMNLQGFVPGEEAGGGGPLPVVPLPATAGLLMGGAALLGAVGLRRRKAKRA